MKTSTPPDHSHERRWTAAELADFRRLHHQLVAARQRMPHRGLVVSVGGRSLAWNLRETAAVRIDVAASATAIVVRSAQEPARLPGGDEEPGIDLPLAVYPLFRYRVDAPEHRAMEVPLGRGRFLAFSAPTAWRDRGPTPVEIRYRESFLRRLTGGAAIFWRAFTSNGGRRLAGRLGRDFCLADLQLRDLKQPDLWQALLTGFVVIPALVSLAVALVLSAAGVSPSTVLFGGIGGGLVALTGTAVCSSSVSVVAASVGGVPVSVVLGITSGVLLQSRGGAGRAGAILGQSPILPGLGGLSALIHPSGLSVALTATAVGLLSLAMGRVRAVASEGKMAATSANGALRAIFIGVLGAAGPGLVYGLALLGKPGRTAEITFGLGLAAIGGAVFGGAARIRSGSFRRGLWFGLSYAVLALLVIVFGFRLESPLLRLVLATTTNHILLQGTFYAFTYVVAEKAGGPGSGVIASLIEGVPPYCIFVLTRPWT
jgi:hypothetical protein